MFENEKLNNEMHESNRKFITWKKKKQFLTILDAFSISKDENFGQNLTFYLKCLYDCEKVGSPKIIREMRNVFLDKKDSFSAKIQRNHGHGREKSMKF